MQRMLSQIRFFIPLKLHDIISSSRVSVDKKVVGRYRIASRMSVTDGNELRCSFRSSLLHKRLLPLPFLYEAVLRATKPRRLC